jgi:hypothetical protein
MKTTHTQGKWNFGFNPYSQVSPRGQFTIKAGEVGTPVCILPIADGIGIIESTNKAQANAKLIAGAPTMLETLKTIESVLNEWNKDGKYTNLIEHAKQAIEKATK